MSVVTAIQGEGGSGKSTLAREICKNSGYTNVRVNRDDLRAMLFNGEWSGQRERLVRAVEQAIAQSAIEQGYDVVVDDTNLTDSAQDMWKRFAEGAGAQLRWKKMMTPFLQCVFNDGNRRGKAHIGRAVIERQFIQSGRAEFGTKPIVIVDVDGTLANHEPHRSPYDESLVALDTPYPVVVEWVRKLMPEYSVVIVSGRTDACSDDTDKWLNAQWIQFDHLFMRASGDYRPDTVVKQEILDGILKFIPKSQIAFVIDDRPSVIAMWKSNGLRVFPARGAVDNF